MLVSDDVLGLDNLRFAQMQVLISLVTGVEAIGAVVVDGQAGDLAVDLVMQRRTVIDVTVVSFENTGERTEDFAGSQNISSDYSRITTTFKTPAYG